ncbi:hypothetical protein N431DRAFT_448859 [Stipitochalara longipes BDJ]|nr:hypothetical protein N431DRAFT_448859 [Stipitochalara longipes BDJ]
MDSNINEMQLATAELAIAPNELAQATNTHASPLHTAEFQQPVPIEVEDPFAVITNNKPGFKYKYPQAAPTPDGEDDIVWNKVYTAADSRMYNKHHKNANESRKYRESGETRVLALKMHAENKEKYAQAVAAAKASGVPLSAIRSTPKISTPTMAPKKKEIKKEASSSSRDGTPGGDGIPMSISEKIKSEGRARKGPPNPPSNQGTPAPSTAPKQGTPSAVGKQGTPSSGPRVNSPAPEKAGSVPPPKAPKPTKKGTATTVKKQHAKKAKADEKAGLSTAKSASQPSSQMNTTTSDSESNDGGEYCICRGPDDHRMMVYCDGGCEDWYHCSCVGIDEDDAKELLDRFICPKCHKEGELFTTWKRMCRCNNVPTIQCRKAARVAMEPPSKYCSDECAYLFWKFVASRVRTDDAPSLGGALNFKEVGQLLKEAPTAETFHKLGQKPRLPVKEGADPGRPVGLDYLNEDEKKQIEEIKENKKSLEERIKVYQYQQKLLIMVNDRAKIAVKEPNLEVKDICGFDNRLAMNEEEFDEWFNSEEGKLAFTTGKLGPRTDETKSIGACVPYPGQVVPTPPKVSAALDNICLKPKRRCKHQNWLAIHGTDFVNMQHILKQEMKKLTDAEEEIIEDAELREATKEYYAENETIQLF